MNTSSSPVSGIDVSGELQADAYRVRQYFAPGIIQTPVSEGDGIEMDSWTSGTGIDLEPFGLCTVEAGPVNRKSNL